MQILPFYMILQQLYCREWTSLLKTEICVFIIKMKCIVLSFSQYVVMNAFILITGQKAHICGMNHIFVLQESSRNESKSCCKLEWSPACMRRDISALFFLGDAVFHSLCYTVATLCCCTNKDEFTTTHGSSKPRQDQSKTWKQATFACNIWMHGNLELSDRFNCLWSAHQSLISIRFTTVLEGKTTPTSPHHTCNSWFTLILVNAVCVCVCVGRSVQTECVRACYTACRWCSTPPPAGNWTGMKWRPIITCFMLSVTHLRYASPESVSFSSSFY